MSDEATLKISGALMMGFGSMTIGLGTIAYTTAQHGAGDRAAAAFIVGGVMFLWGFLTSKSTPHYS
ncbi:MAG: hypothetical protein HRU14_07010 [Planctomycetes bacterium]|nr:hypothetical protein [Planctomycetota bacterium]